MMSLFSLTKSPQSAFCEWLCVFKKGVKEIINVTYREGQNLRETGSMRDEHTWGLSHLIIKCHVGETLSSDEPCKLCPLA